MGPALVECVPNISEGRDSSRVQAVADAITSVGETLLLHRTSDGDHNRSVFTFAAPPAKIVDAALAAVAKAAELIDLNTHTGVHPRLGALDVLPFVPLAGLSMDDCVALAREAGSRIWNELGIPVYFYEQAALRPDRRLLENVRRGQFEGIRAAVANDESKWPDLGGPQLHPTAGAVIVGARKILVAFNINLGSSDLSVAKSIAKKIRSSSGGFPFVKALGFPLRSRGLVQVSMNLTDFEQTPLHVVYSEVERLAASHGIAIEESELIGLLPRHAVEMTAAGFLKLKNFQSGRVIENRIGELRGSSPF